LTVSCIIERGRGEALIAAADPSDPENRYWEFVSGWRVGNESPESAMRRVARERVGLDIDIHAGQPPFAGKYEGRATIFRFFLAGAVSGEARAARYAEIRWVKRGRLCEYDFLPAHKSVVKWYAE
jgi:ADP-ribose pyrophosphatase YjhB (NUDIX family)